MNPPLVYYGVWAIFVGTYRQTIQFKRNKPMNFAEELKWRGMVHDMIPGTEEYLKQGMATEIGRAHV